MNTDARYIPSRVPDSAGFFTIVLAVGLCNLFGSYYRNVTLFSLLVVLQTFA